MADDYADNPTMRRLIGKAAGDMAATAKDPETRKSLTALKDSCAAKRPAVLDAWEALDNASKHYSGEMHVGANNAGTICALSEHWTDDNIKDVIDNF